jgi:hypothetical protein
MFIAFYGVLAIIVLLLYLFGWILVGIGYLLVGLAVVVAVIVMGVFALLCSLVLGLARLGRYRSSAELRRGLSDGWLFGIGQSRNMSKSR